MKYFLGSYNFFQYVFFMILYMTWVKLAKLTLLTTRVVLTTSSNNIFDSRDNVTFSSLLSIFILFPVFKCRRGGGKERDRESLKIWQLTALWGQRANISAIIGLWKELSKRKVFKKQLIVCIKRLRQFCGIKKYPKKNRVVRTTHGRRRTYKEGVLSCFVFFWAKKPFLDMRECISVHLYRVWRITKELLESCTTRTTLTTRYSLSPLLS